MSELIELIELSELSELSELVRCLNNYVCLSWSLRLEWLNAEPAPMLNRLKLEAMESSLLF